MNTFTKILAKCNVAAVNAVSVPPRTAMDYAAASKHHECLKLVANAGGKGLCKKGEHGGYVAR